MKYLKWGIPLALAVLGIIFSFFLSGCSFLGIVCFALALIISLFFLLSLLEKQNPISAKVVRTVFSLVLIGVLAASAVTLVPILRGPEGSGSSDFLIVLGAGVRGDQPSEILADRIRHAAGYLKAHPNAVCIATGGKGSDENISEAQCIYDHLTALGIDGSRIWLEDKATSTIENFRYSIALIEGKTGSRPESVTVLSNEFHLYRASRMAADCGLQASFSPAPTSNLLIRISYTAREIFALWKYLLIGG